MRRTPGSRPRVGARWSWCVIGEVETFVHPPVAAGNPLGLAWYGPRQDVLDAAITEAVTSLPAQLRAAAARPRPLAKTLRLSSVNPRREWSPFHRRP